MLLSNSKLTEFQKGRRNCMLKALDNMGGQVYTSADGVTLCILPEFENSRMMLVSVAVMSHTEKKLRPKVGEFHALCRMFEKNEYIKIPTWFAPGIYDADRRVFAQKLADTLVS